MKDDKATFFKIEQAISYMHLHFKDQPSLDVVADTIGISPFHFQKLFTQWAGVSPKKFIQYLSLEHAKKLLNNKRHTLLDVTDQTGLSSTGRLHDLFVNIEGMTPGDYKNGGENLTINYWFCDTLFGKIIVASTPKGVCHMMFEETEEKALGDLKDRFPNAVFNKQFDEFQKNAISFFKKDWNQLNEVKLHLKCTPFQLKVWQALLNIPQGHLHSYGDIAREIKKPKASRAVGTAIGSNPVAFLIPCHRVIQSTGNLGGYMWGTARKAAIIGWESARAEACE